MRPVSASSLLRYLYQTHRHTTPTDTIKSISTAVAVYSWSGALVVATYRLLARSFTGYNVFFLEWLTLIGWLFGTTVLLLPLVANYSPTRTCFLGSLMCFTLGMTSWLGNRDCSYCPMLVSFTPSQLGKLNQRELLFYLFEYQAESASRYMGTIILFVGVLLLGVTFVIYREWQMQRTNTPNA